MGKTATERPASSSGSSEAKYKGVRKRKWGKWVSEIRLPNSRERIWLGSFDTAEKAARAFDAALFCLRGPDAKFNFPETPPPSDITGGRTLSPQEIQVVAARFANSLDHDNNSNCRSLASDGGGAVHVDSDRTIDWSFLNMLDSNELGASDFGFYSGIDDHINMNMTSDELYVPPAAAAAAEPIIDDNGEEDQNGYASQTSSFLWNF